MNTFKGKKLICQKKYFNDSSILNVVTVVPLPIITTHDPSYQHRVRFTSMHKFKWMWTRLGWQSLFPSVVWTPTKCPSTHSAICKWQIISHDTPLQGEKQHEEFSHVVGLQARPRSASQLHWESEGENAMSPFISGFLFSTLVTLKAPQELIAKCPRARQWLPS